MAPPEKELDYLNLLLDPLDACAKYKPKFGTDEEGGISLASTENYLPVLSIISTQASRTVLRRYKNARMLVMTGILSDDDTTSTYAFFRSVIGFELDEFFKRNTDTMKTRCQKVLQALLAPS